MEIPLIAVLISAYSLIGIICYDLLRWYFKADHDLGVLVACLTVWPVIVVGVIMLWVLNTFGTWIEKRKEKKK